MSTTRGGALSARRKPSVTSSFGVSRRESHDASDFYRRFVPPVVSPRDTINPPGVVDEIRCADARNMEDIAADSVALVVTSPPYFAGKEYERTLGEAGVPATYFDYLQLLYEVFARCVEKLEPGGRIAVNVANLGRKPYRSLAADVIAILQDRLGLLLRGEVVWHKARGANGSCAWGSWQSPANPVLRDVTERVVIASKGRFDRAHSARKRALMDLPSEATLTKDEFLEATTDVWEIAAESATQVGHPAPFPVELPLRLIHLYTYRDDVVLDPFMGSGTTAVAAVRSGRHFIGYDTDADYVATARRRVAQARDGVSATRRSGAVARTDSAAEFTRDLLETCGFLEIVPAPRLPGNVEMTFCARGRAGRTWYFDVCGAFTVARSGLRRADVMWKALGRAAVLRSCDPGARVVLLTTELPVEGGPGDTALRAARGRTYFDALQVESTATRDRLAAYAGGD